MTATMVRNCPVSSTAPWSSPEARLVLRADAPRDEWLAARKTGIGSSDASAVLGLSKWSSPYEVWAEKRGLIPPDPDNTHTELGRLLEPIVVGRWSEKSGIPIRKAGLMASRERPWQLASVDRLAACGGIVEAKTLSYRVADEWEDGQTPDHAEAQVQHQLAVTGRSHAHVVGLQDGRTWLERLVVRDDALIPDLTGIEEQFWTEYVVTGVEPPIDGSAATTEALSARWPGIEESEVELGQEGLDYIEFRAEWMKKAKAALLVADEYENQLRALMGDATVGWLPGDDDGDRKKVTWRRNGTFSTTKFAVDHPELAARLTHPLPALDVAALKAARPELHTTYRARVLRVPKI